MKWSDNRYSKWELFKNWMVHILLKDDLEDMIADARAEGIGDGYTQGHLSATRRHRESEIDLYEQGKRDGIKEEQARLKTFDIREVISQTQDGTIYIGGQKASDVELSSLKQEAKALKEMRLYEIFQSTVGEVARQKMFEQSQDFNDMLAGKAMLYSLDKLGKIVKAIDTIRIK